MRSQLVYSNPITRRPAASTSGDNFSFPEFFAGKQYAIAVRHLDSVAGALGETYPVVLALRANIGRDDARPLGGTYKLQIGVGASTELNTTAAIDFAASASTLLARLNDLEVHTFTAEYDAGSYLIRRTDNEDFTLTVQENKLRPVSFGRIHKWTDDTGVVVELRLIQSPAVFTDTANPILPPTPSVVTVIDGFTDGDYKQNEVQNLLIPPTFRGQFYLVRDLRRTQLFSRADGVKEYQAGLNALLADEEGNVSVTNPERGVARIEFGGELSGVDLDPLTVEVPAEGTPPGDLTFVLDFNTPEVWALLRSQPSVTLPFEVEIDVPLDDADEESATKTLPLWSVQVTIRRPLNYEGLATAQPTGWLRKPNPKSYLPYNSTQIGSGQLYYEETVGDGVETEFEIDHNLGVAALTGLRLIELSTGRVLNDEEFTAHIANEGNTLELVFDTAPDTADILVTLSTPQPIEFFINDLEIDIAQVDGLQGVLDNHAGRLTLLEALLPRPGVAGSGAGEPAQFTVPDVGEILPDVAYLATSPTIASQVTGSAGEEAEVIPDTTAGQQIAEQEELEESTQRDPDALPPNVVWRAVVPAIGRTATRAVAAVTNAAGEIMVPEIPETSAIPAVWPALTNGRLPILPRAVIFADTPTETAVLPALPTVDPEVYEYTGSTPLLLPGGGGRATQYVPEGGFFASHNVERSRFFFRAYTAPGFTHYYPLEMDRELVRLTLGPRQFPSGTLTLSGELRLRLITDPSGNVPIDLEARDIPRVNLTAQYSLLAELVQINGIGSVADGWKLGDEGDIHTIGSTRLLLGTALESMRWSLKLTKAEGSDGSSEWTTYGRTTEGDSFPTNSILVLRVRLAYWDVNNSSFAKGQVALIAPQCIAQVTL